MTGDQFLHMAWTIATCCYGLLVAIGIAINPFVYSWEKGEWWLLLLDVAARLTGFMLGLHVFIRWIIPILDKAGL